MAQAQLGSADWFDVKYGSRRLATMAALSMLFGAPAGLSAQESFDSASSSALKTPDANRDWFGTEVWKNWSTATGNWASHRNDLASRGVSVGGSALVDLSSLRGEAGREVLGRALFAIDVEADAASLTHVPGGVLHFQMQMHGGRNASGVLGDLQGFSNLDADRVPLLGALYFEQAFSGVWRVKAGRMDATRDFAGLDAATEFLSSAMGYSPSIEGLSTYPDLGSGVTLIAAPSEHVAVSAAAFDGSPGRGQWFHWQGRFQIAQVRTAWQPEAGRGGSLTAGVFTGVRGANATGASGLYFSLNQQLWKRDDGGATGFLAMATSDTYARTRGHVASGVEFRSWLPRRPLDVSGVGATWVRTVDPDRSELALELFYRIAIAHSLSVVPDAQWLFTGDHRRTMVFTTRVRLEL